MYELTEAEIRFLLNQDRLTKTEGIALLTRGYNENESNSNANPHISEKIKKFNNVLSLRKKSPKNQQDLFIYNKILEISETMDRSMGTTLFPIQDVLDYAAIGAPDPTFRTEPFLNWAEKKGFLDLHLSEYRNNVMAL
jgi:hypothetical protein